MAIFFKKKTGDHINHLQVRYIRLDYNITFKVQDDRLCDANFNPPWLATNPIKKSLFLMSNSLVHADITWHDDGTGYGIILWSMLASYGIIMGQDMA